MNIEHGYSIRFQDRYQTVEVNEFDVSPDLTSRQVGDLLGELVEKLGWNPYQVLAESIVWIGEPCDPAADISALYKAAADCLRNKEGKTSKAMMGTRRKASQST